MEDQSTLFNIEDKIFEDKELLEINHLPEGRRIVGRDDKIEQLANLVNPAIFGQSPNNALIYGKTGTGKSLCAKYVSRELVKKAEENDVRAAYAYVDCAQDTTETQAIQSIGTALNELEQTEVKVPEKGISTATYYKRIWNIMDELYDVVVIILDEIDKLEDDDILMQLSRAGEAGKLSDCKVGVMGVSNKIRFEDRLDERVKSSLCEREIVFQPYDANQLGDIMDARRDAFVEGVLNGDVIPKAAAVAAQEHGDARKAIDILRYAGEIAQSRQTDEVKAEYVDEARERAQTDRFRELIRGLTVHSQYVLYALTIRTLDDNQPKDVEGGFRTTQVYGLYERICSYRERDPLSTRRVRDLLGELAFLDIIEQNRVGGGRGEGSYTEHKLIEDPETVHQVLKESEQYFYDMSQDFLD
jgi:cell division control protein 6